MQHSFSNLPLSARFTELSASFYAATQSTPLPAPYTVSWNAPFADALGITANDVDLAEYLVGNKTPHDQTPCAGVYSGHQFGVNAGQLGDGRALLIAEFKDPHNQHWEMQLKGAGPTPFSRRGDGRAVLRSTIREYLCSEAIHGLGIPTTRALAIGGSDAAIWRETRETAAVLTRIAPTFVRFGHFEHFFYQGEPERIQELADWTIQHHYPNCLASTNPYLALLEAVIQRTAALIAQWQAVGFCHGVMNTDNMSILGLTLDYGPFGFLDGFNPNHICNHSDDQGRYAYRSQPQIGLWNLHCFAQALVPLVDKDLLLNALAQYQAQFEEAFAEQLRKKLGFSEWLENDWTLVTDLFELMHATQTDWTIFWRTLSHWTLQQNTSALSDLFLERTAFSAWLNRYQQRIDADAFSAAQRSQLMLNSNPKYILRNHLAEVAIRLAEDQRDFSEIERLRDCLSRPFSEQAQYEHYAAAPPSWASELSVSCSS